MSNSPLVSYTKISPNKTSPRNHKIDTITIHCVVGHLSLETIGDVFAPESFKASSNYGIDDKGRVGMYVEEKDRSWCSSSSSNDNRAITIEMACDLKSPYKVTDDALKGLIDLCTDICKRNGIPKLLWKNDPNLIGQIDKQNMTVHRWFKNKDCPGDYLMSKMSYIAAEVNKKLQNGSSEPTTPVTSPSAGYVVRVTCDVLNVRSGPGTNYKATQQVRRGEAFTIVATEGNWGKLKSGAGWISLNYTVRV